MLFGVREFGSTLPQSNKCREKKKGGRPKSSDLEVMYHKNSLFYGNRFGVHTPADEYAFKQALEQKLENNVVKVENYPNRKYQYALIGINYKPIIKEVVDVYKKLVKEIPIKYKNTDLISKQDKIKFLKTINNKVLNRIKSIKLAYLKEGMVRDYEYENKIELPNVVTNIASTEWYKVFYNIYLKKMNKLSDDAVKFAKNKDINNTKKLIKEMKFYGPILFNKLYLDTEDGDNIYDNLDILKNEGFDIEGI